MSLGEVRNELGAIAEDVDHTANGSMAVIAENYDGLLGKLATAHEKVEQAMLSLKGMAASYEGAAAAGNLACLELQSAARRIDDIDSSNPEFSEVMGGINGVADGCIMNEQTTKYNQELTKIASALLVAYEGLEVMSRVTDQDRQLAERRRGATHGLADNVRDLGNML